ncbi:MAG: hypothetical protein M3273_00730 [Actinomycetota bacterium]|nr:hypothetical protein [Actinomycetota bacterium]
MLKKILVSLVAASLVAAPVGASALAKGKKKGPKPWVSPTVTIQIGHPAAHSQSGTLLTVTAQEFIRRCALPASNGVDAYVFAVPDDYKGLEASVKAIGTGGTVQERDLDLYLYDASCTETVYYNAVGTDEFGVLTADTEYILLHNYLGDPVTAHIELTPPAR